MTNSSHLPILISYLQALAVPMIAIVITGFGAWIARQQMVIAGEKLRLEAFDRLYERRFAVYEATRIFLADVYQKNISDQKIQVFGLRVLDAKFLFDDDLYKYLTEIRHRVEAWNSARPSSMMIPFGTDDRSADFKRIESENLNWLKRQGDEQVGFDVRFRPFLMYKPVKRYWWLR
jgi:hypothetical protein